MHMLGFALESGRALVIAVNKWDGLSEDQKEKVRVAIDRKLPFLDWADIHFISAKHGTNVGHLYESIDEAYTGARSKWSTQTKLRIPSHVTDHSLPSEGSSNFGSSKENPALGSGTSVSNVESAAGTCFSGSVNNKAMVRFTLLKLLKSIFEQHQYKKKLLSDHQLVVRIQQLVDDEEMVLVNEMATQLLALFAKVKK